MQLFRVGCVRRAAQSAGKFEQPLAKAGGKGTLANTQNEYMAKFQAFSGVRRHELHGVLGCRSIKRNSAAGFYEIVQIFQEFA